MRIGAGLFLIAVGAILKFAITKHVNGIDLGVVGVILMVVGIVGIVLELIWMTVRRRTDVVHHDARTTYVEPAGPIDRSY